MMMMMMMMSICKLTVNLHCVTCTEGQETAVNGTECSNIVCQCRQRDGYYSDGTFCRRDSECVEGKEMSKRGEYLLFLLLFCHYHSHLLTVTVTEALVLRPLLEDRGRITESIRILVPVDRMKQKCFQITTKQVRRSQQFQLRR